MATISATQPTPPTSSNGGAGSWEYAVPTSPRLPLAQQTNGFSKMTPPRSDAASDSAYLSKSVSESEYLPSARVSQLNRKHSEPNNRSEPDSLLELYKSQARSRTGPSGVEGAGKRNISGAPKRYVEEDENNWIHRDKLAQIESRELEEAGFKVPALSRSMSRSHSNSLEGQDEPHQADDILDLDGFSTPEINRQHMASPVPADDDFDFMDWELRTPEEVAAEQQEMYTPVTRPLPRQRGSRLPVKKMSTISNASAERDSPAPRSRNVSGHFSGSGIPEPRPRSRSVGSHNLLENDDSGRPQTPMRSSVNSSEKDTPPRAAKAPSKGGPASAARKATASRNVSTGKPRQFSQTKADSPPKRPGTSSGTPRPSTSHRPEGQAPWIASMYKPDPRLPPDQQMLPTHAKRLAQQQWEKEGKTGTMYDREFRLLNVDAFPEPKSPTKESGYENEDGEDTTMLSTKWPLQPSPLDSPRLQANFNRPGTSGTEHGGYKTMPTIHQPPTPTQPAPSPKPKQPTRVQEPLDPAREEKKTKKENENEGLCGCCVVM